MKVKEYVRLGKISIKSRKKSTRNTVTGICFGLIMLIPVLFFTLSFYIGLTGEINKTKSVAALHLLSRNVYDTAAMSVEDTKEPWQSFAMMDYNSANNIAKDNLVKEAIKSEYYSVVGVNNIDSSKAFNITMSDDKNVQKSYYAKQDYNNNGNYRQADVATLKIIHMPQSGKYVTDAEISDYKDKFGGSMYAAGGGFTVDTLGKTEILVSEDFCAKFFTKIDGVEQVMSPLEIVGKKISFSITTSSHLKGEFGLPYFVYDLGEMDADKKTKTINYIQDFVVAGVISSNYYKLPSATGDAHVWLSSKSVYDDEFNSLAPTVKLVTGEDSEGVNIPGSYKCSFTKSIANSEAQAKKEGRMIPAYGAIQFSDYDARNSSFVNRFSYITDKDNLVKPPLVTKIQCDDYAAAQKLGKKIDSKLVEMLPSQKDNMDYFSTYYSNDLYSNFIMMNTIGGYVMIVLYAFGGIIFFATMLNLYNSVNYSVQVRKNYMGVMRAIGAKSSMIPKLYFWEIVLIFMRALPWVLIIGGGISYGIKALIDLGFKYIGESLGMIISLNFGYFFAALGVVVAGVFLIALAFSQIAASYAAKRPILDVLSDDKG